MKRANLVESARHSEETPFASSQRTNTDNTLAIFELHGWPHDVSTWATLRAGVSIIVWQGWSWISSLVIRRLGWEWGLLSMLDRIRPVRTLASAVSPM